MEVNFGPGSVPTEQVAPTPAAPVTSTAVAAPAARAMAPGGPVLGDYIPTFKDIILPHLTLAQNMGELGKSFAPGTLVFDNRLPLFTPPQIDKATNAIVKAATSPVIVTILGWKDTRFVQKIEGSAERGMVVNNEAAVVAAGGTTDWQEWQLKKASGMKYFQALATALTLIQRPDSVTDDDTIFTFEVDGAKYALAWWNMKGAVYTEAARKVFFTARQTGCLRVGGYPSYNYAVSTKLQSYPGGKSAWVPVCLPKAKSTPSFLEFAKSVLNPTQATQ